MIALTKAEEEIMLILWKLGRGYVRDVLNEFPDPKPAYTTVSTLIRILETKGVVGHTNTGRNHLYFPLVDVDAYKSQEVKSLLSTFFKGSFPSMVQFFTEGGKLSKKDIQELENLVKRMKDESGK
jgi:predicted transcriptional regulator